MRVYYKIKKINKQKIYVYGTGSIAKKLYKRLQKDNIQVDAFVVSQHTLDKFFEKNVYVLDDVAFENNECIILGMNLSNQNEVFPILKKKIAENCIVRY